MIKKTRIKFFGVTSGIVAAMIILFCGLILGTTRMRDMAGARDILDRVMNTFENRLLNDGEEFPGGNELPGPPEGLNPDGTRRQISDWRTFVVKVNESGTVIVEPTTTNFTLEEIQGYVNKIREKGELKDFIIKQKNIEGGKIIAAIDVSEQNAAYGKLMLIVLLTGTGIIIVLLILIWFLSFWMVKPAEQSLAKQKRFISEASHELKTPLTVASAGLDLLQKDKGISKEGKKWLDDVKAQIKKMTRMTTDLLSLSKIDEHQTKDRVSAEFNLSGVIHTNVLTFESVAFEQGKKLVCDIQEDIRCEGNIKDVYKAIEILCDNAIKHSDEKSKIIVSLKKQGSRPILTVMNKSSTINQDDLPLLFERFYRGSESRALVPGTGLGLAIFKTIAEQNDWKIDVKFVDKNISFILTF